MKKLMMAAVALICMTMMSVSLTACGGDDDSQILFLNHGVECLEALAPEQIIVMLLLLLLPLPIMRIVTVLSRMPARRFIINIRL